LDLLLRQPKRYIRETFHAGWDREGNTFASDGGIDSHVAKVDK